MSTQRPLFEPPKEWKKEFYKRKEAEIKEKTKKRILSEISPLKIALEVDLN